MKRAVITGATGAIGTALVDALIQRGVEVLVLCRKESPRNENILSHPLVTKYYCSLEELKDLKNVTGKKYDVFYHFAWKGTTGEARNNMYLQNENVKFSLDAVRAAKELGCELFVGAGSQAEYGRVEGLLRPDTPPFPENGYGMAKLCAGQMTREYAASLGIKHIWVRILSIYGPNDGAQSMVMSATDKFSRKEKALFTTGEQQWDYLFSKDAAEAFCLMGEKYPLITDKRIYVLGSGTARPLKEYIRIIHDAVDPDSPMELGAVPYSEKQVMYLCADISLLTEELGWKPHTRFDDGIKQILSQNKLIGN